MTSDAPLDPAFRVVSGHPTDDEVAALTAVLLATLRARQEQQAHAARPSGVSAWQRSQRALRTPLTPGAGRWRAFGD